MREVVGHGAPGFLLRQVQDDEVLVFAGDEKARNADRLTLPQWRALVIILVILESKNGQRQRLVEPLLHQKSSEDGPHLLKAQSDLAPLFFTRVGDHGEMRRVDFKPRRRLGGGGGYG